MTQDRVMVFIDGGNLYSAVKEGIPLAIVGSHGFLEVGVNMGNAFQYFKANIGDPVKVIAAKST